MRTDTQRRWMQVAAGEARELVLSSLIGPYRRALELGGTAEAAFGRLAQEYELTQREMVALRRMAYGKDDYTAHGVTDLTEGGTRVLRPY